MRKPFIFYMMIIFSVLALPGCSSSTINPVESQVDDAVSGHSLIGIWSISFDSEMNSIKLEPDRSMQWHYNATWYLMPPSCYDCIKIEVNSWNPTTKVLDVDATLKNPYLIIAYDVRGIIFTDDSGLTLTNADAWTDLFDIPGGEDINPFKAFAKDTTQHAFVPFREHTENFRIYLPDGSYIRFAIDVSIANNCAEPYSIENFTQTELLEDPGSTADLSVDVYDWQDDVDVVSIAAYEITGDPVTYFTFTNGNTWETEITNNTGAQNGIYKVLLKASSEIGPASFSLYKYVNISVGDWPGQIAYWSFDEGSGTDVFDSSGNDFHGVQSDSGNWGTQQEAYMGNSCFMQESGRDCVEFPPDPLDGLAMGAVDFYVMFFQHGTTTGWENSIITHANGINTDDLSIFEGEGQIYVGLSNDSQYLRSGIGSIDLNQWYHVRLEMTGKEYILYLGSAGEELSEVDRKPQTESLGYRSFIRVANGIYGNSCHNQRPLIGRLDELSIEIY